jgi:tetratricopeptide (TPR) repeat protein
MPRPGKFVLFPAMADFNIARRLRQGSREMALRGSPRDVRLRALAITVFLVVAGGLSIAYMPDILHTSVANGSAEARAAHAREKIEEEIKLRFEQGVDMLNAKQYEQALAAFHRVLALSPSMPEAHLNMGFALIGLKRYAIARDFFEGAISLRKEQVNAYYGLAEALEGVNDLPGAIGAMRTYLHLAPADDPYRLKAEEAVWKWEARMDMMRQTPQLPRTGVKAASAKQGQD